MSERARVESARVGWESASERKVSTLPREPNLLLDRSRVFLEFAGKAPDTRPGTVLESRKTLDSCQSHKRSKTTVFVGKPLKKTFLRHAVCIIDVHSGPKPQGCSHGIRT